jgi:CDP-glucose 4,6-dehydratase
MFFNNIFDGKVVLITGHTGFKGSWLTTWLLKLGASVVGFSDRVPTNPSIFETLHLQDKINHNFGDIRDFNKVKSLISDIKPDFVFHLAAQSLVSVSIADPIDTISTNVIGTSNLLQSVREINHHCAVVVVTSDKCYENNEWVWGYRETDAMGGKDIYSASKGAAEIIFKSFFRTYFNTSNGTVKLATGRAGNVIGGGDWSKDRIIVDCIREWTNGKPVQIRSPNSTRPWQHVLEPLSGYLSLASSLYENGKSNGESFNFGPKSEQNRTVLELIQDLSKGWGFTDQDKPFILSQSEFHSEAILLKLNCDKALSELKWESNLDYIQCVDFVVDWYKNYYFGNKDSLYDFTLNQIQEYENLASFRNISWAI